MHSLELRVPPLALVAIAAALMWLLARFVPVAEFVFAPSLAFGAALIALGAVVAAAGVFAFRRAHTTVNPMTPDASSAVVATGVYRLTRNPMYLGFLLALVGWALMLGSLLALLPVAAFVGWMNRFQIEPEERALRAKFGPEYEAYLQRVRRWF